MLICYEFQKIKSTTFKPTFFLKILILYTYNKGLLSRFYQELSEKLAQDGHEVSNFYLKHKTAHFEQHGVQIHGAKRKSSYHNVIAIYNIIKRTKPNVVVSNFSYINPAILCGKLLGVKHNMAWFHSAYGYTKPSIFKIVNKSLYLNLADLVLTNSPQLEAEMHSVYKVPKRKTRSIPFWTNIEHYTPAEVPLLEPKPQNTVNIGCPGRLEFEKNQQIVIESIYELKHKIAQPIKLYIAGKGSAHSSLKILVEQLQLTKEVVFLGALSVNEMVTFYQNMDVVVLPSFHEAFGLVFIEAIALGTPVLVSSTFGALDFIDSGQFDVADFSFDPNSKEALVEKLSDLLQYGVLSSEFYKQLYSATFNKQLIYEQLKSILVGNDHLAKD